MTNNIQLYFGDCLEVMKQIPDNSVDTIITDPPYGLKFMGKKWDYDVPSVEIWKECLRITKPGATLLSFAGSRTQHRMAVNIEDAGWALKDVIMWMFATGFPKATAIGVQIDKKLGKEREIIGFKKYDFHAKGTCLNWGGCNDTRIVNITIPATKESKLWEGWKGHSLKPAYEPIILAMKPNDGSYAENALKYGVAGLNIDGGRIPYISEEDKNIGGRNKPTASEKTMYGRQSYLESKTKAEHSSANDKGRFPANIIWECCCDETIKESMGVIIHTNPECPCYMLDKQKEGASRFFYIAKTNKSERNKGCENLPKKQKIFNGQSQESSKDLKDVEKRFTTQATSNSHPTVKPLKLMKYLCNLTKTPTGGVVLDPFMGSGTTGVACKLLGRRFIGIEISEEYMKIAKERIENANAPNQ